MKTTINKPTLFHNLKLIGLFIEDCSPAIILLVIIATAFPNSVWYQPGIGQTKWEIYSEILSVCYAVAFFGMWVIMGLIFMRDTTAQRKIQVSFADTIRQQQPAANKIIHENYKHGKTCKGDLYSYRLPGMAQTTDRQYLEPVIVRCQKCHEEYKSVRYIYNQPDYL